eukprot:gene7471-11795_t
MSFVFRSTRKLFFPKAYKETTGLVGIPPQPRWREMTLKLIDDVLSEIKTIPEDTFYRVSTENNFNFFKKVILENEDYEKVEEIINRGQVEELIMMIEDELQVIPKMREHEPWVVTQESADAARAFHENGDDYSTPDDYVYPELSFSTSTGRYQVTYTPEEIEQMKKKLQEEKEKTEENKEEPKK